MNYLFLAEGFEIVEAMAPADMISRAGIPLTTVSISQERLVSSSHGIQVYADIVWDEFKSGIAVEELRADDILIFPGGMPGSVNLAEKTELMDILQKHFGRGGNVAAICAAPSVVLGLLPDLEGKTMTCYDGFEDTLKEKGVIHTREGVAKDGRIITGRGAGHTVAFGLEILAAIKGREAADSVARSIML